QKVNKLSQTGIANKTTQNRLKELVNSPFRSGKSHLETINIKIYLTILGYANFSTPNNYYAAQTKAAVKKFQRAYKLPETGVADSKTRSKLKAEAKKKVNVNFLKNGDRHSSVTQLKKNLYTLGYLSIKNPNNYYASQTEAAVKKFQKDNKLPQTGIADKKTQDTIKKEIKEVSGPKEEYTNYRLTLKQALDIQMERLNIKYKYKNDPANISASYVNRSAGATINASVVNVRTKPNTTSSIPFQLKQGDSVHIVKEVKGTSVSGSTKWYEIKRNGKSYYVHSSLVSTSGKATVKATVNVRSKKSASSHIFGQITKGSSVTI